MADEMTVRARVTGRVQGVWFRGWTEKEATKLGLRGWVKNEPDGSVSALIAGPRAAVVQLVTLMHDGPEAARVSEVETQEVDAEVPEGFSTAY